MAANSATVVKGSPHSSDEASHQGTPSTNLTAFSPEGGLNNVVEARPLVGLTIHVTPQEAKGKGKAGEIENDPFTVVPTPTSARSILSPDAESFTPALCHALPTSATTTSLSYGNGGIVFGRDAAGASQSAFDNETRTHDDQRSNIGAIGDPAASLTYPFHQLSFNGQPSFNRGTGATGVSNVPFLHATINEGVFTTDEDYSRAFMVMGIECSTSFGAIATQYNVQAFPSLKGIWSAELGINGTIYLSFSDVRDAVEAFNMTRRSYPEWSVFHLTAKDYAKKATYVYIYKETSPSLVSDFEGQIILTVFATKPTLKAGPVFALLKDTLATFGHIKAMHTIKHLQTNREVGVRDFRIEFYDTRAACNALASLARTSVGDLEVAAAPYKPDIQGASSVTHISAAPPRPRMRLSATGRSVVPLTDYDHKADDTFLRYQARKRRGDVGSNHNQVDVNRIQSGLDVRTTIMLRNIPNKIDQGMLKQILDETSQGCYDFMYLRIGEFLVNASFENLLTDGSPDFANNCNVGYAFINFVDALAIIPFAIARAGQRWNKFNSDKVAEISYATIQGKDCLVQKFRNSSVMLEHPTFRPKVRSLGHTTAGGVDSLQLFTTGTGPDAGEEEGFPGPDNPSKMRRSVENAEHVGLFPYSPIPMPRDTPSRLGHANRAQPIPASAFGLSTNNPSPVAGPALAPSSAAIALLARRLAPHVPAQDTLTEINRELGLFAPRQGQIYREEQRRRRSIYDRGTSAAEYEAYHQTLRDPALDTYQSRHGGRVNTSNVASLRYAQMTPEVDLGYLSDY